MAQRCFAAKRPKDAIIGSLLTAVILLCVTAIPVVCGILGRAMGLNESGGAIFMQVVQKTATPWIAVLASSSVLLAIVSTASAILLALSSNVSRDLVCGRGGGALITCVVGALALVGPYISDNISDSR